MTTENGSDELTSVFRQRRQYKMVPSGSIEEDKYETHAKYILTSKNYMEEESDIHLRDRHPLLENQQNGTKTEHEKSNEQGTPEPSDTESLLANNGSQKLLCPKDSDDGASCEKPKPVQVEKGESSLAIALQVFFPYIIAGFGTVGAGMVLDIVQHWTVFNKVSELFILVPPLLGLKGNLGMTLASRLSTQVNLGYLDTTRNKWLAVGGNIALNQAQAIVVAFLGSVIAMVMGWVPEGKFSVPHAALLCASSILTNCIACLVLGSMMMAVVICSRSCKINPDNIATPLSASLGDLVTLFLLAGIASGLYKAMDSTPWLSIVISAVFIALTPLWIFLAYKNKFTKKVVSTGWTPVIFAMVISSLGGVILDFSVSTFKGIAVFQPVINGVGGNLVAVQASRISTSLHRIGKPGHLPDGAKGTCPNPVTTFLGKGMHSRTARVLLALVIPGHMIFLVVIAFMTAGHTTITLRFACVYLLAALLQVVILLYSADWMVHSMWKSGDDPDNFAIPYLTAIGDLLGTALLALVFVCLHALGDKDADVGE